MKIQLFNNLCKIKFGLNSVMLEYIFNKHYIMHTMFVINTLNQKKKRKDFIKMKFYYYISLQVSTMNLSHMLNAIVY